MIAFTLPTMAQTNLVGRVYKNDNIMKKELDEATKDFDKELANAKAEAIAKALRKQS